MTDATQKQDELAGTEQPFVQHLMELRDRLIYSLAGLVVCMILLAIWPSPSGLIDLIAAPIRAHMPPGASLINASRGTVVEIDALVEALRSGRLAGLLWSTRPPLVGP